MYLRQHPRVNLTVNILQHQIGQFFFGRFLHRRDFDKGNNRNSLTSRENQSFRQLHFTLLQHRRPSLEILDDIALDGDVRARAAERVADVVLALVALGEQLLEYRQDLLVEQFRLRVGVLYRLVARHLQRGSRVGHVRRGLVVAQLVGVLVAHDAACGRVFAAGALFALWSRTLGHRTSYNTIIYTIKTKTTLYELSFKQERTINFFQVFLSTIYIKSTVARYRY